jgi:putative hemolysin
MQRQRKRISTRGLLRPTRIPVLDAALAALIDKVAGLSKLNRLYQQLPPAVDDRDFLQRVLGLLAIEVEASARELAQIPREGPVVVVANHPFGAIEGVIMAHLLRTLRADVRIVANGVLKHFGEIGHLVIGVDPFGGNEAARRNIRPLREAMRWVHGGGLLTVFPAGEVSNLRLDRLVVTDPPWNPAVASIVRRTGATVVPVYVHGSNGMLFHLAGLVHARLRTAMLPRELLNKSHRRIRLSIGAAINIDHLRRYTDDQEMTAFLRLRTYLLGLREHDGALPAAATDVSPACRQPVMEAVSGKLLQAEFESLPATQTLVIADEWRVVHAQARQIPWTLQEIGRLRELTFRAAGEGTGRAVDIDLFDDYYLHMYLWNAATMEIVGAYRLGLADEIVGRYGLRGLYTHSLFNYRRRLVDEMLPALELGRSFVRAEYQKSYTALMLLWRGIGEFVARNPKYATLYGPVSISNDYQPLSRALLVDYLRRSHLQADGARDVRPRRPFRAPAQPHWRAMDLAAFGGLEAVDELIADIEPDGKGTPVLVRHYVKMGGRFLGFNVDDQFGDALDGLVTVDLRKTEPRLLARYMGKAGAQQFLEFQHREAQQTAA